LETARAARNDIVRSRSKEVEEDALPYIGFGDHYDVEHDSLRCGTGASGLLSLAYQGDRPVQSLGRLAIEKDRLCLLTMN
jgi:hypothetical protein